MNNVEAVQLADLCFSFFPNTHRAAEKIWAEEFEKLPYTCEFVTDHLTRMFRGQRRLPAWPEVVPYLHAAQERAKPQQQALAPPTKQEKQEAAAVMETIQAETGALFSGPGLIKHPGWDSRDFNTMRSFRRLHNIPPPVGPSQRAQRKKMSPALVEEERNLFRAISAGARERK